MSQSSDETGALPLGFGMALAQNEAAMKRFAMLTDTQRQEVINRAHTVQSRQEMQRFVASIGADGAAEYY